MSKLCPHIIGYTNWAELRDFIKRTQPAVIKVVGPDAHNTEKIKELKRLSPNSLWLLRHYLDSQPLDRPKQNARDLAELIKPYVEGYHIIEGYNEIDPRDHSFDPPKPLKIDTIKRYNEFEVELASIVHSWGKKYVCGCWSNGQPPDEAWQYMKDAVKAADYVSLHRYGWPTMSQCTQFTLRYRHIYRDLLPFKRPLILSEMGITHAVFGGSDLGWKSWDDLPTLHAKENRAMAEWAWLVDRINSDDFVVAVNAYTTGRLQGDGWGTHDFTPRLYERVGDYIVGHPSPSQPQPEPEPTPEPQPEPIPEPQPLPAIDPRTWSSNGIGMHFRLDLRKRHVEEGIEWLKSIRATITVICCPYDELGMWALKRCAKEGITAIWRKYVLVHEKENFYRQGKMALENGCRLVLVINEPMDTRDNPRQKPIEYVVEKIFNRAKAVVAAGALPGIQFLDPNNLALFIDYANGQGATYDDFWKSVWFAHHGYHEYSDTYKEPPDARPGGGRCFLGFLEFADVFERKLGFVSPIIVTELSYQTPNAPAEWWLPFYTCYRDGVLPNGDPLPDYLIATCPWIMAGGAMGLFGGYLAPDYAHVVEAFKNLPPFERWKEEEMRQPIRVLVREDPRNPNSPILGVETMELEEYLPGVIPQEMPPSWPMEALKAQAVAARCYAERAREYPRHAEEGADICNTIHCQAWLPLHFASTDEVVKQTEGVVGRYQGEVINALYSGHCGGHTLNNEDAPGIGGIPVPYLRGVDCIAKGKRWGKEQYGHRVGMCQWGAHDMAEQGKSYEEILKHYYTGITIGEMTEDLEKALKKLEAAQTTIETGAGAAAKLIEEAKGHILALKERR